MSKISEKQLETLLEDYANNLGITDAQRDNAIAKYETIGSWLSSGEFFREYAPIIYPQGSFALGTVVRPAAGEEFDLDIIVQLTQGDILKSSKEIKAAVNARLSEDNRDNPCLHADKKSCSMCYTLSFPKQFSMDVVPARYEDTDTIKHRKLKHPEKARFLDTAIKVVNRAEQWLDSNPKGYIKWFDEISKESRHKGAVLIMNEMAPLPANKVRTPLQNMVQILKKHASEMFASDALRQYKPESIAITTLAALSYKREYSLYDALCNFKSNALNIMGNELKLENPANPGEWFSQMWENDEVKKKYLKKWLDAVDSFIRNMVNMDVETDIQFLNKAFTKERLTDLESDIPLVLREHSEYQKCLRSISLPCNVSHAAAPKEAKNIKYHVDIIPKIKIDSIWRDFNKFSIFPLPKNKSLLFEAVTNCPSPYKVRWQIVNTGDEARAAGCLRGEILDCANDANSNRITIRRESTLYAGVHWIQCYVLDNSGMIVAESSKCYVPIR